MWFSGRKEMVSSFSVIRATWHTFCPIHRYPCWVSMAPFGMPVVPDV